MNARLECGRRQRRPHGAELADFVEALSELASGVVIVTCTIDGRPWGMTVTAFHSVSAAPPTVLISLGSDTTAVEAIDRSGTFGVSVLSAAHAHVARHASRPRVAKHFERFVVEPAARIPAVEGAIAHLDCEVADRLEIADHTVFFAHVLAATSRSGTPPLVYHRRRYRTLRK